ncbi:MAG TPA: AAA family ATPase [Bryobacteraceae bacterium]|nr:AAA family ATPase [Bryobacteraceae bacterium]
MIYRGPSEITDNVNSWFKTFGIPYAISIKQFGDEITGEVIALHLLDQRSLVLVGPSDVGFGIGQLLPVIVQGLVSTSQSLCVEQPEIHLHPKLQASLADFFIASSGLDPNRDQARSPFVRGTGNQWIIETHSEALVLRLQKRIREHAISCEDVCVLYVLPGGESGSRVLKLRLDEDGEFLDTWPEGFFEESFTEIFG